MQIMLLLCNTVQRLQYGNGRQPHQPESGEAAYNITDTVKRFVCRLLHEVPSLTSKATASFALSTLSFTLASFSAASTSEHKYTIIYVYNGKM